jgi:protease-4
MRFGVILAVLCAGATVVHAQVDTRYAEEPTVGLELPATPLAGEHDARAVVVNPGGVALLRGPELDLALDTEDSAHATSSGQGFGVYTALTYGGKLFPKLGQGLALEWLRPPRTELAPDPGTPVRLTYAWSMELAGNAGFGVAWHHFLGDKPLGGTNAFDLGLSTRWGSHLAIGGVVRDLATGTVAGVPVQRRYELEAVVRPTGTDRLEVALGGRVGETREDVDGWVRAVVRAKRGAYVIANVESRDLHELVDSPTGVVDTGGRELRATLGLELSFGGMGITSLGTGVRDRHGDAHALGGTFVARVSTIGAPSLFGHPDHIERIELSGDIGQRELTGLVVRLRDIARDPTAKALVVVFDGASAGMATLEELRDEVVAVRRAGKKVFAYMVSGTGRDYFVASAADKIYVDPAGGVRLVGMAGTTLYFKGLFDQLGVLPQFEKIAEYKSAPEQFTENGPSVPAAKMHNEMFDSLWESWVAAVADGRHLARERVQAIVDAGPYSAGELAQGHELVDAVATPQKVSQLITAELGGGYEVQVPPSERPDRWAKPKIAVVYIDGDIVDGKSRSFDLLGQKLAGGETLVRALAEAREDPAVGAVILRIDSPGGSALASELISREVFAMHGVKPILCSMSDLAASGGYFVAAGCDVIYAERMTITGSIGIFSGKFDISALAKRFGVASDTYKRGKRSDLESYLRPYTDEERTVVMGQLRYMYGRFVGAVADGRKLTKDEVDAVGRGHVYTGIQAQPIRLVDRFGGLGDAIDEAKRRIGVPASEPVQLYELPELPDSLFGLLGSLVGASRASAPVSLSVMDIPAIRELLHSIPASLLVEPDAAQARLPFDVMIK